jgi:cupin 2 domain-containing protein
MNAHNKQNLFNNIPGSIPDEIFETIISTSSIKIERIISKGQKSAPDFWYDQEQSEWILVLQGEARVQFEDKTRCLASGDYINIAPHQKHRIDWTTSEEETIWLAIFY